MIANVEEEFEFLMLEFCLFNFQYSPPSPRNPGKGGNEGKTGGEYRMRGKSQSPEWAQDLGEENMYKLTLM